MRAGPDCIIFDCDGVLVDSEPLAVDALVEVLQGVGVAVEPAMVERCFGMKQADILRSLSAETGQPIPEDVGALLWPATRRRFEAAPLQAMPGIHAFLQGLPDVPRCVASSSHPERIAASLAITGLAPFFGTAVFSATQVARGKPAPDLFLHAAATLAVEPSRCVVIEDSIYGIQAARAAGMVALGFSGGSHIPPGHEDAMRLAGAHAVERSWPALRERLGTAG